MLAVHWIVAPAAYNNGDSWLWVPAQGRDDGKYFSDSISNRQGRHCEERSDEAIHITVALAVDCFASLAMTVVVAALLAITSDQASVGGHRETAKIRPERTASVRDRAGHLVHRPRRSKARGRSVAPWHRSRHDSRRHRRDVWRRRAGGCGCDRRTARQDFPGLESIAEQRVPARHHHRMRAFAEAAEDRPARLLSPALAWVVSADGNGCRVRATRKLRKNPFMGCQQFRHGRSRGDTCGCRRGQDRLQPGALSLEGTRDRTRGDSVVRGARRCGGRLFAVRPQ